MKNIRSYLSSKAIADAIDLSKNPYLESYSGKAWLADMFVAMASLRNYDKLDTSRFQSDIQSWLREVQKKLDPQTQLIPHKVNSETNAVIEGPRGSSVGLSLLMLREIDPAF